MKIIKKIASLSSQADGTVALNVKDFWNGIERFEIVVNITSITGAPTDVTIKLQELIDSVAVDSASITATSTGASRTTGDAISVGNDAQISVSFNGGTSPTVTADVYVAAIQY